jgi:hypothetical protein
MIHRFKISVYGISLAAALSACAVPAYAQQNTCTTEQLQLPSARECMRLLDQDVVNQKKNGHMLVCSISGIRCCVTDGKGGYRDCGPLLDTKSADDKKAADAKKKAEEEAKKKQEAKRQEEEAKKKKEEEAKRLAAQKAADPKAGLKFECVPAKDGSKDVIKVFITNNSDAVRTCTVECTFTRSDKKSGSTKCSDVRTSAGSPRNAWCTDWGDKTGPGPFTNAKVAKAECR